MEKLIIVNINDMDELFFTSSFSLLNKSDQEKIMSYKQEKDQKLCLTARLLERKFVKDKIEIGEFGKPICKNTHFNISHSYPYVVLYLNNKYPVGVDIEKEKELDELTIKNCFNKNELNSHSPIELFTLKEAYLKYIGTGINTKLSDVKINFICSNQIKIKSSLFYKTFKIENYFLSLISKKDIKIKEIKITSLEKIL